MEHTENEFNNPNRWPNKADLFGQVIEEVSSLRKALERDARPASEQILDECDLLQLLKISKRTSANYRQKGYIKYSKVEGKIWYNLQDVLDFLEKYKVKGGADD